MASLTVKDNQSLIPIYNWTSSLPKMRSIQRSLLILTVACGILTVIPPLRLGGALALRSISLISHLTSCVEAERREDWLGCVLKAAKLGVAVLGLTAVVLGMPLFAVISLIADAVLQMIDGAKAVRQKDHVKAGIHAVIIIVDAFALAALFIGSWQLMVVAGSISILAMLVVAGKIACDSKTEESCVECLCYLALAALGVASACSVARLENIISTKHERYSYTNKTDRPVEIYEPTGNIAHLEPGATYTASFDDANHHWGSIYRLQGSINVIHSLDKQAPLVENLPAEAAWQAHELFHEAMEPKLFPTVLLHDPTPDLLEKERA